MGEATKRHPFGQSASEAKNSPRELIARARWIALDLDATRFSVLCANASHDNARLSLCFDNESPQISAASRALLGPMAQTLLDHSFHATTPCVWSSAGASPARSPFTRSIAAPVLGTDGIAFPVYTSNGQSGLVIFFGRQAEFSEALLFEAHARCFQLFESSAVLAYMDGAMASVANRERDCLELSSHGLTSEEIAAELGLSPHTVNQYLTNTARKLGAVNRVHVVAKALRLGLID